MTEKELLEKAARSIGLKNFRYCPEEDGLHPSIEYDDENDCTVVWMPHIDDGDALRLASALNLKINISDTCVSATDGWNSAIEVEVVDCKLEATRLAITRAAAAMTEKE